MSSCLFTASSLTLDSYSRHLGSMETWYRWGLLSTLSEGRVWRRPPYKELASRMHPTPGLYRSMKGSACQLNVSNFNNLIIIIITLSSIYIYGCWTGYNGVEVYIVVYSFPQVYSWMLVGFIVTEATVQQVSNKARREFCTKHDSFADFCFAHHKSEPLLPVDNLAEYDPIREVSLWQYCWQYFNRTTVRFSRILIQYNMYNTI